MIMKKTMTLNLARISMAQRVHIVIGIEHNSTVAAMRMKMSTWTSLNSSDANQLTSELIQWPCAESSSNLNKSTNWFIMPRNVSWKELLKKAVTQAHRLFSHLNALYAWWTLNRTIPSYPYSAISIMSFISSVCWVGRTTTTHALSAASQSYRTKKKSTCTR